MLDWINRRLARFGLTLAQTDQVTNPTLQRLRAMETHVRTSWVPWERDGDAFRPPEQFRSQPLLDGGQVDTRFAWGDGAPVDDPDDQRSGPRVVGIWSCGVYPKAD